MWVFGNLCKDLVERNVWEITQIWCQLSYLSWFWVPLRCKKIKRSWWCQEASLDKSTACSESTPLTAADVCPCFHVTPFHLVFSAHVQITSDHRIPIGIGLYIPDASLVEITRFNATCSIPPRLTPQPECQTLGAAARRRAFARFWRTEDIAGQAPTLTHGKGCDCVIGGREGDYVCVPRHLTKQRNEQRCKETLLWREGGREWLKEPGFFSVFPEDRSAGGEKIKAERQLLKLQC